MVSPRSPVWRGHMSQKMCTFVTVVVFAYFIEICAASFDNIEFHGRFDIRDDEAIFSWPGTRIETRIHNVETIQINITAPKSGARLLPVLNGTPAKAISIQGNSPQVYTLVGGLDSSKTYHLSVWKITEDNDWNGLEGATRFHGFVSPTMKSKYLVPPGQLNSMAAPKRRFDFVGDSNTAGWCADGLVNGTDDPLLYQNAYVTWAPQLAQVFDADVVSLEAITGAGVEGGAMNITKYLDRTNEFDATVPWNYSDYPVPDAILFFIGMNDCWGSCNLHRFKSGYMAMLNSVAARYKGYGTPRFIHVCGEEQDSHMCEAIEAVSSEFSLSFKEHGIYSNCTSIQPVWEQLINNESLHGCDGHWNQKGHALMVQEIVPQIQDITGW